MDLAGFALAVLIIELTPGPNMAWLVTLTLSEGRRAGLAAIGGVAAGLAANAAVSVLAASLILAQGDGLTQVMSVLAAAMMGWLAWEAWRDAGESSPAATPRPSEDRHAMAGFVINLLNPKSALFMITVMPQFVASGQPTFAQGLTLAAISVGIATAIHLALVLSAGHVRAALMAEARARIVRRVLALAMLGVAVWFLAKAFG
ncbi:MAG: LysE family translocator [Sphingomonadales bacterium]|nr:LysE family translocator [Sphingomonadales bacterium]